MIDGRGEVKVHGPRDMPVWGDWFDSEAEQPGLRAREREIVVRERISGLTAYLKTLQEKWSPLVLPSKWRGRSICIKAVCRRKVDLMRSVLVIFATVLFGLPVLADDIATGRALAEINCGRCHALDETGDSPFKDAPPFRTIHDTSAEGELEEAFNDGIVVAHPAMPDWTMTSDQARQLAAFITSFGSPKP